MELHKTAKKLVASFAKANRVSAPKTTDFVQKILCSYGIEPRYEKRGRKASNTIIALHNNIKDAMPAMLEAKTAITTKNIASQFNVEYIDAYHAITAFEKMGYFVRNGKLDSTDKGRKQVVWAVSHITTKAHHH